MSIFNKKNEQARTAVQTSCPTQGEQPQGKKTFVPPTLEVILFPADMETDIIIVSGVDPNTGEIGNDQDWVPLPD